DNTAIYENGTLRATLNTGQVYSAYYPSIDITGRHITSNHPIAYFVTNSGVYIPATGGGGCDCFFAQMLPVNTWGNSYLVPISKQGVGRLRVLASQNGTVITQTGGVIKTSDNGGYGQGSLSLNAGEFVELEALLASGGCHISSNKPVAVSSYLVGKLPGYTILKGDPALTLVPPVEQMIRGAAISAFITPGSTQIDEHHALIMTPTATRDQTTVAVGTAPPAPLSGGTWTTGNGTAGSAYSFYSFELTDPDSSYYFANPYGMSAMGYGLGGTETYYYLAGAAGRNLDAAFYVNGEHYQNMDGDAFCGLLSLRAAVQYAMSATPGYLKWYIDGVEETAARDLPEWTATPSPGTHTIKMSVLDMNNETHELETTLTVIPASAITVHEVADTVVCVQTNVPEKVFTSPVTGATFTWTNDNTGIGLAAGGAGNLPAFTPLNPGTATITVTPSFGNCTGTPLTYTLIVSPCVAVVNPHLRIRVTN
ncbi:MAG: IgGFc-binding protein, partial [Tannerellaceae bacterium]|nr:IgGFc-binding protein [Tannerellaceae bacterium]